MTKYQSWVYLQKIATMASNGWTDARILVPMRTASLSFLELNTAAKMKKREIRKASALQDQTQFKQHLHIILPASI